MRKLIFAFALMLGVTFASCGNSTSQPATGNDSIDTVQVDTVQVDSTVCLD